MSIRLQIEKREAAVLAPAATLSARSCGRVWSEPECEIRTAFQRDRDRIIHSKAFRRLKDKTQVFLVAHGDHYRTRLTHSLEVAQIARTIAKALRLNEDLTEAIALGHDLGHTPFGHSGEDALDHEVPGGFRHAEQGLRVVDLLEQGDPRRPGLNLTHEVRDGIAAHGGGGSPLTPEGRLVQLCDRVAYINHDIDDALRGGIIRPDELPPAPLKALGHRHSERIHTMVKDIIHSTQDGKVRMSDPVARACRELREFLFERVYANSEAKEEEVKAKAVVVSLYRLYRDKPSLLEAEMAGRPGDSPARAACDHVAGMTDRYAIATYTRHFLPLPWRR
ncbi:MAG: deoxyguanosinetriphosphate triphosphohydrolase [bacterium]|nr:deoxyguanosinetriphosphate triphosphohydrolase [bacterium]